jgi:hypothetical protein
MPATSDQVLSNVLTFLIVAAVAGLGLRWLIRTLRRARPDFAIGKQMAAALIVRVLMAAAVSLTSFGTTLRGGDEPGFLFFGQQLGAAPLGSSQWSHDLFHQLFIFIIGVQDKLLAPPDLALRVTEAAIAVGGLVLLACAVYDLAGPRAAGVAAWLLAFEPTGVFFSTLIHKESLMTLASGLVAFGAARYWTKGRSSSLIPMAAGCAIAAATRGYVSWFLLAASAAVVLHGSARAYRQGVNRSPISVGLVLIAVAVAVPVVVSQFTSHNLHHLEASQQANATDQSNLQLEEVNFSSGPALLTNLPLRIRDVIFRPYPWELGNVSQQLGLMGSLVVLVGLVLLVRELFRRWGSIMSRAGPFVYLGSSLLVVYALAAGNAGTAFRYRTHVVEVGLCLVVCLAMARSRAPAIADTRVASAERLAPPPSVA